MRQEEAIFLEHRELKKIKIHPRHKTYGQEELQKRIQSILGQGKKIELNEKHLASLSNE